MILKDFPSRVRCLVWAISWLLFALKFLTLQANTLTVIALRSNSWQWRNVPTVTNCYNQDSSASGGANMTCWYLRIANLDYPEAGNRTHRYLIAPWKWTWFSTSMIIRLSECLSIIRRFSFREREHAIAHRIHIRYIYLHLHEYQTNVGNIQYMDPMDCVELCSAIGPSLPVWWDRKNNREVADRSSRLSLSDFRGWRNLLREASFFCLNQNNMLRLGGGFNLSFIFTPRIGEFFSNLTNSHIFSNGLVQKNTD